ncbi:hypothetical protein ACE5D9_05320 [Rickettsia sp. 2024-CO-Wats]|uniref:hypothetical protein n=1 Tax=unclassified Rickettsia TaxID=114295 RepID=UPI00370D7E7D
MNEAELIFTALVKLSTRQVAETNNATGMEESKVVGKIGENKTGKKVISTEHYLPPKLTK